VTELPVEAAIGPLRDALGSAPFAAVLHAPPGAGKTTLVPLRLLDEPWLDGRIVVLEPRRLATRAAARRMAHLLGEEVGATVGYRTRDERRVGRGTRIEVVTEGILTRRLQADPELPGTSLVVFDEVHERSLQGDLGLALCLEVRGSIRPDLRLLAMSATVDGERLAALLGRGGRPAPVVRSEGRAFPVDIRWVPAPPRVKPNLAQHVAATVARALAEVPDGDVLAFLPGAADIRRASGLLAADVRSPHGGRGLSDVDVRPLFGALSVAEQDLALAPSEPGRRKIVLATDIAETSLTVEGVAVIVDGGQARTPRYDPRSGLTRLVTVAASRASADQRAGRAGRTGPGVAYRCWSKLEHAARRPFADPEISQVDLAGLALELACWGTEPAELAFLDQPPSRALAEARTLLMMLGAIDAEGRPTALGRNMANLPLHPRLARMVAATASTGDSETACFIAALLEDRDVLRGHPDELPVDVSARLTLLAGPGDRDPRADVRAVQSARRRAGEIGRRVGARARRDAAGAASSRSGGVGRTLALAYPDRVAQARGGARFRLRSGGAAWVSQSDGLAHEVFLCVADLDAGRGGADARIRIAAPLSLDDLLNASGSDVMEHATLIWDERRNDLVVRVERRLEALILGAVERRPEPGPMVVVALLERVRSSAGRALPWTPKARLLQQRVGFLRRTLGELWPDLSDGALLADLEGWLAPLLTDARGRADLEGVDLRRLLAAGMDHRRRADLDRLAPLTVTVGSREMPIDWSGELPTLTARVQALFGITSHPTVAGGAVPIVVHLLSPAGRPVQVTSDLPGFWAGSWKDVRKAMAGRYPKHAWPEDPSQVMSPPR